MGKKDFGHGGSSSRRSGRDISQKRHDAPHHSARLGKDSPGPVELPRPGTPEPGSAGTSPNLVPADVLAKGPPLIPGDKVLNRILWDGALDKNEFEVGYEDRFAGLLWSLATRFRAKGDDTGDVPMHRIRKFRYKGLVVWDRDRKFDCLDSLFADPDTTLALLVGGNYGLDGSSTPGSGGSPYGTSPDARFSPMPPALTLEPAVVTSTTNNGSVRKDILADSLKGSEVLQMHVPQHASKHKPKKGHGGDDTADHESIRGVFRLLSFNVLHDLFEAPKLYCPERVDLIVREIVASNAQVVGLQEVTPALLEMLRAHPAIGGKYYITALPKGVRSSQVFLSTVPFVESVALRLSRNKYAVFVTLVIGDSLTTLVNIHLLSDYAGSSSSGRRVNELGEVFARLGGHLNVVVLGDFNFGDDDDEQQLVSWGDYADAWLVQRARKREVLRRVEAAGEAGQMSSSSLLPAAAVLSEEEDEKGTDGKEGDEEDHWSSSSDDDEDEVSIVEKSAPGVEPTNATPRRTTQATDDDAAGYTFDLRYNFLADITCRHNRRPRRLDRVLFRGPLLDVQAIAVVAKKPTEVKVQKDANRTLTIPSSNKGGAAGKMRRPTAAYDEHHVDPMQGPPGLVFHGSRGDQEEEEEEGGDPPPFNLQEEEESAVDEDMAEFQSPPSSMSTNVPHGGNQQHSSSRTSTSGVVGGQSSSQSKLSLSDHVSSSKTSKTPTSSAPTESLPDYKTLLPSDHYALLVHFTYTHVNTNGGGNGGNNGAGQEDVRANNNSITNSFVNPEENLLPKLPQRRIFDQYAPCHQTALALVLPEWMWPSVNAIREENDRAFARWDPHINFLWPFIPIENLRDAVAPLAELCSEFRPFSVTFGDFGYFPGKRSYVHLTPDAKNNELHVLQTAAKAMFPTTGKMEGSFTPHCTVGQFERADLSETLDKLRKSWTSVTIVVSEIHILEKCEETQRYKVKHTIPLGIRPDALSRAVAGGIPANLSPALTPELTPQGGVVIVQSHSMTPGMVLEAPKHGSKMLKSYVPPDPLETWMLKVSIQDYARECPTHISQLGAMYHVPSHLVDEYILHWCQSVEQSEEVPFFMEEIRGSPFRLYVDIDMKLKCPLSETTFDPDVLLRVVYNFTSEFFPSGCDATMVVLECHGEWKDTSCPEASFKSGFRVYFQRIFTDSLSYSTYLRALDAHVRQTMAPFPELATDWSVCDTDAVRWDRGRLMGTIKRRRMLQRRYSLMCVFGDGGRIQQQTEVMSGNLPALLYATTLRIWDTLPTAPGAVQNNMFAVKYLYDSP